MRRLAKSDLPILDEDPPEVVQHQHRLKPDEVECLVARYQEGATTYDLAEEFHCHRTTVSGRLKRAGVKIRGTG